MGGKKGKGSSILTRSNIHQPRAAARNFGPEIWLNKSAKTPGQILAEIAARKEVLKDLTGITGWMLKNQLLVEVVEKYKLSQTVPNPENRVTFFFLQLGG